MEEFERPFKKVSRVKALFFFHFWPKAFGEMAIKHDASWIISRSDDIRKAYLEGTYEPNLKELGSSNLIRTNGLRKSLHQSLITVGLSALLAIITGNLLHIYAGPLSTFTASTLQAIAVGIILWATLWQLSRDLQSFGGESLAERVHSWTFSFLYILGTLLFFIVYAWQA